jgi:hypothetical protein
MGKLIVLVQNISLKWSTKHFIEMDLMVTFIGRVIFKGTIH